MTRTPNQKPPQPDDADVDAILDRLDNQRRRRAAGVERFQPRLRAKDDRINPRYFREVKR